MSSNQNVVTLPIGSQEPQEYLSELHKAVGLALLMIFERRTLDLDQEETFALYTLVRQQSQIVR